jgi:Flp pilus assembly CpaE family ATPase
LSGRENPAREMKQRATRRAPRYQVHLKVEEINGQQVTDTYIKDISALGVRLESTTTHFKPFDQVELSFHPPNEDTKTRLAGVVVWVKSALGRLTCGIQFNSPFMIHSPGAVPRPDDETAAAGKTSIISFIGSKGGVGNTFLTINVAYLLAKEKSGKVLVVDLDLPYGQAIYFFDAKPKHTIIDAIENFEDLDKSYLQSLLYNYNDYLSLLPAPVRLEEVETVTPAQVRKILHYLKNLQEFKWIFIDCPHHLGEVTLTALESSDHIFLTTAPSLPALYNAKKLLELLDLLGQGQSKVSVILNSLQKQSSLMDSEVQEFLGQEIKYKISCDPTYVDNSIEEGKPLGAIAPKVAISLGLKNIADMLTGDDSLSTTSRWSRVKGIIKK